MNGADIKKLILDSGVKLWQVAARWGLTDSNFSRRLRRPFNEEDVKRVKGIVAELITEQQTNTSK
ncbi:MAG: hypothetical protein ACI4KM_00440 [Oscillospiraceae bacterium]